MLLGVCCVLCVLCCLLMLVRGSLFVVCWLLCVVCCALCVDCCVSCVVVWCVVFCLLIRGVCCLLFVVRCSSCVVRCLLFVVCWLLCVVRCFPEAPSMGHTVTSRRWNQLKRRENSEGNDDEPHGRKACGAQNWISAEEVGDRRMNQRGLRRARWPRVAPSSSST